ncbi:hypothetical protein ABMA27_001728 [Loxostege sticticalis]|uniref:Endonuclease-reverse transcriptase n=1 Tax=Loxostege sticticalis TaxID=481309 RepID=A0ABR3HZJ4_LOXSC
MRFDAGRPVRLDPLKISCLAVLSIIHDTTRRLARFWHILLCSNTFVCYARVDEDVNHRVNTAWLKWRSLSGVLCDTRMPVKTKGKIYKTAVRPAMLYGAECWTALKKHEQQLHTAEMKMLRWAGGVTRLDRVRNEHIRGSFKVTPVPEKLKETRLRWYGHIMRREENYSVKTVLNIETQRRQRGRPPATWWSNVERDLKSQNLSPATTRDRISWRRCTRRPDPS